MEFKGSWDNYLALIEFAYNNSYQTSIGMAPYEALYGRKCRTPVCWESKYNTRAVEDSKQQVENLYGPSNTRSEV